jgi:hypothetical protein
MKVMKVVLEEKNLGMMIKCTLIKSKIIIVQKVKYRKYQVKGN